MEIQSLFTSQRARLDVYGLSAIYSTARRSAVRSLGSKGSQKRPGLQVELPRHVRQAPLSPPNLQEGGRCGP